MKKWIKKVSLASLTIAAPILAISGGIVKANNNSNNVKISINYDYQTPTCRGMGGYDSHTYVQNIFVAYPIKLTNYKYLAVRQILDLSIWGTSNYYQDEHTDVFNVSDIINHKDEKYRTQKRKVENTSFAAVQDIKSTIIVTHINKNTKGNTLSFKLKSEMGSMWASTTVHGEFEVTGAYLFN